MIRSDQYHENLFNPFLNGEKKTVKGEQVLSCLTFDTVAFP